MGLFGNKKSKIDLENIISVVLLEQTQLYGNELYFLSFRITSSYIVTFTCTCNVHQKSKALLISSQSDGVKSL